MSRKTCTSLTTWLLLAITWSLAILSDPLCAAPKKNEATSAFYGEGSGFTPDQLVTYKDHPKRPLQLHVFHPPSFKPTHKYPTIILFFGGGWSGNNPKQLYPQAKYLASRGMLAICATYRSTSAYKTEPYHC